jgi:hypothetical protein
MTKLQFTTKDDEAEAGSNKQIREDFATKQLPIRKLRQQKPTSQ